MYNIESRFVTGPSNILFAGVCVCVRVRACVCAWSCVRACVRVCVCVCLAARGYRECTDNGTWWLDPLTGHEWTDYTACVPLQVTTMINAMNNVNEVKNDDDDDASLPSSSPP